MAHCIYYATGALGDEHDFIASIHIRMSAFSSSGAYDHYESQRSSLQCGPIQGKKPRELSKKGNLREAYSYTYKYVVHPKTRWLVLKWRTRGSQVYTQVCIIIIIVTRNALIRARSHTCRIAFYTRDTHVLDECISDSGSNSGTQSRPKLPIFR